MDFQECLEFKFQFMMEKRKVVITTIIMMNHPLRLPRRHPLLLIRRRKKRRLTHQSHNVIMISSWIVAKSVELYNAKLQVSIVSIVVNVHAATKRNVKSQENVHTSFVESVLAVEDHNVSALENIISFVVVAHIVEGNSKLSK